MNLKWLITYMTFMCVMSFCPPRLLADTLEPQSFAWADKNIGTSLDLSNYELVFSEEFSSERITPDNGAGPWYAPVHGSYGSAVFDVPGPSNNTYSVASGVLTIKATKEADGWHGGNIETVNTPGKGFAQKFGYFEARMKFPNMPGAWPAFWLKSQEEHTNPSIVRPEIDVVEWYGGDPKGVHSTVHLWVPEAQYIKPGGLTKSWGLSNYVSRTGLTDDWHTYGCMVTPQYVTMYVDGKATGRFPTFDEFKLSLYPLVTLTLYAQDVAKAISPIELSVDYVRVYAPRQPKAPGSVQVTK